MTINTKYNIGDSIYSMRDNKVYIEQLTGILTDTQIDHKGNRVTEIRYKTNSGRIIKEDKVFNSKEELLATL